MVRRQGRPSGLLYPSLPTGPEVVEFRCAQRARQVSARKGDNTTLVRDLRGGYSSKDAGGVAREAHTTDERGEEEKGKRDIETCRIFSPTYLDSLISYVRYSSYSTVPVCKQGTTRASTRELVVNKIR